MFFTGSLSNFESLEFEFFIIFKFTYLFDNIESYIF